MSKLVKVMCLLAVFAIIALPVSSFAQEETKEAKVSIGAWGKAIFAPGISNDQGDTVPAQDTSWGGTSARIGWTIKGESENVGFHVDMNCDGGSVGFQDQQKAWAKPFSFLTVEIGPSIFYEAMRGDAVYGAWNWMRFSEQDDEDAIFVRGKAGGGDQNNLHQNGNEIQGGWTRDNGIYAGSIIHVDVAGFHAFASLDQSHGSVIVEDDESTTGVDEEVREQYTTSMMFKRGQYGAGYELPGIGMIRAQYIGKAYLKESTDDELTNYGVWNAAFKVDKLVPGLYVDLGYFHPTEEFEDTEDSRHGYKQVNGIVHYTIDALTLHATGQTKFDKPDKDDSKGTALHLGVGADYGFALMGGNYTITTDFRYFNNYWTANADVDNTYGVLVGISKGFSNGKVGVGFEYTTTTLMVGDVEPENPDDAMWAIPIVVEYSF
jgi:hypothetical protein